MAETIALNIAYAVYVASGLVKTVVRLRLALVVVSVVFIVWGLVAGIWAAVAWNVVFGAVHIYQLVRIWRSHRAISLDDIAAGINRRLFPDLNRLDFFTMWSIGSARTIDPGTLLIEHGATQETVMLIVSGTVSVARGNDAIATLGPDALVGERSFLTGDKASADVCSVTELTVHEWNHQKVSAMAEICPAAYDSMMRFMGLDLAAKL